MRPFYCIHGEHSSPALYSPGVVARARILPLVQYADERVQGKGNFKVKLRWNEVTSYFLGSGIKPISATAFWPFCGSSM